MQRSRELRALLVRSHEERFSTADDLLVGVQLTHSGRVAHPEQLGIGPSRASSTITRSSTRRTTPRATTR